MNWGGPWSLAPNESVIMLGFGGPTCLEEVRPFIMNVVSGRNVPPERIEQVVEQYKAIGGRSPFNELTMRQAKALEAYLHQQGQSLPVFVGMLNWSPFVKETIESMATKKIQRAVGIVMAPHRSDASFDRYVKSVKTAIAGLEDHGLSVQFVQPWYDNRLFIEVVAARATAAIELLSEDERLGAHLIFVAHSIPTEMTGANEYEQQIRKTASLVADVLDSSNWTVAYTSRSGTRRQQWLEPDICDLLANMPKEQIKNVVVVPIGFVCDHVEVLYDLDLKAASKATECGIKMIRAGTAGDHPKFIELLGELVISNSLLEKTHGGDGGH